MRLRSTRLSVTGCNARKRDLNVAALTANYTRPAVIYSDPNDPSYNEILNQNRSALGPELVTSPTLAGVPVGGPAVSTYSTGANVILGRTYCITMRITGYSGTGDVGMSSGTFGASARATANGVYTFVARAEGSGVVTAFTRSTNTANFSLVSIAEIVDWTKPVLFDDPNGTVPVFSVFQSTRGRGLLLDRSKGLSYGANTFSDAAVTFAGGSSRVSAGVYRLYAPGGVYSYIGGPAFSSVAGRWYQVEFTVDSVTTPGAGVTIEAVDGTPPSITSTVGRKSVIVKATGTTLAIKRSAAEVDIQVSGIQVREIPGNHMVQPTAAARGEISRRYNELTGTEVMSTQSVTVTNVSRTLRFSGSGSITLSGAATGTYTAGAHTITPSAGSLTLTVSGSVSQADLRLSADAIPGIPAYQRVTSATDYDESGYPAYWRGQTDDWAYADIDPAGATKAHVIWCGQKMSDASQAILVEHNTTYVNDGSLTLFGPANNGLARYGASTRGITSTAFDASSPYTHPAGLRTVFRVQANNGAGASAITPYVNGAEVVGNDGLPSTTQGPYLTTRTFFGARAGTSAFANVREFAPPFVLFMQPADPGPSAREISLLDKRFAKAAGVTL